jgi:hypothetical protein
MSEMEDPESRLFHGAHPRPMAADGARIVSTPSRGTAIPNAPVRWRARIAASFPPRAPLFAIRIPQGFEFSSTPSLPPPRNPAAHGGLRHAH